MYAQRLLMIPRALSARRDRTSLPVDIQIKRTRSVNRFIFLILLHYRFDSSQSLKMQQSIRLSFIASFIVISIFALRTYGTIRISGGTSYTYDPRNPSEYRLFCNHNNDGPTMWTRNGEPVEPEFVLGNGRLR